MKATLVKRTGESKRLSLIFSLGYFCFGPFYYLVYKMFFRFLILAIIYVFGVWKQCGHYLVEWLTSMGIDAKYIEFLEIPGEYYWVTLGVVVGLHIVLSFITPRIIIKKLLHKKGYVPYSEIDAQLLVKYSLAKVGTIPYLANFKPINGVKGKIKIENTAELNKKLDELASLLKEGMINKDEYNTKRAEVLMNLASKKWFVWITFLLLLKQF